MAIAYNTSISANGLVAAFDPANTRSYSGTGTAWNDIAGGNYNSTLTNGPTFSSSNGGFFTFDGVNDYAVLTRPVQDDFSLCCWFKSTQNAGTADQWYNGRGLIDCEVGGATNDFGLSLGAGKLVFGTGNPDISTASDGLYNDGNWHYAVATRSKSAGQFFLYADGTFLKSAYGGTQSLTAPSQMRIGSIQTGIAFFAGSIAAVQIYNRVLTAADVSQNFNALRGRFGV